MACKLRQYLLTKSNLTKAYHKQRTGKSTARSNSTNSTTGHSVRTISQLTNASSDILSDDVTNGSKKYYWILPASLKKRYLRCSTVKLSPPCENEHVDPLTYEKVAEYTLETLSDVMDEIICQYADQIDTDVSLNVSVSFTLVPLHLGPCHFLLCSTTPSSAY